MEVGKREITSLSLHCHHQNDSCIKMGSDTSFLLGTLFLYRGRLHSFKT